MARILGPGAQRAAKRLAAKLRANGPPPALPTSRQVRRWTERKAAERAAAVVRKAFIKARRQRAGKAKAARPEQTVSPVLG